MFSCKKKSLLFSKLFHLKSVENRRNKRIICDKLGGTEKVEAKKTPDFRDRSVASGKPCFASVEI